MFVCSSRSRNAFFFQLLIASFFILGGCNSSTVKDAIEVAEGIPRKTIDTNTLGMNAFANNNSFGSIPSQYAEVRNTLGLRFVRILFGWDENVQPSPASSPNFSFYDEIMDGIPAGMDALIILTGIPNWMDDPANWIGGNPRETFHELWVKPVVDRYGGRARVVGFQIWNEPNMASNSENITMDFLDGAENYVELVALASNYIKDNTNKLVVNAATTAINQNFPGTLDYNRRMRDAGIYALIDRYAFHYYGKQFENFIRDGGVKDFLNSVPIPLWITETGAQGVNSQLGYGEQVWPYLTEQLSGLERIYVYQFTEATPSDVTYGLRNPDPNFPVSDLYVHLRDRAAG